MLGLRCCAGFSLVGERLGLLSGCSAQASLCCRACLGLSSCDLQAPEFRLSSYGAGSVVLLHAASSPTSDWTWVSCTDRWLLYQWASREAQEFSLAWVIKKTMKFKFNWYIWLILKLITIISEFIKTHSTEEITDVSVTEPCKFLLIKHHCINNLCYVYFYNFL